MGLAFIHNWDVDPTGYSESWTREAFKVIKVLPTYPYTYILEDLKEDISKNKKPEVLLGALYEPELTLADPELSAQLAE